jgi:hypothetical protein
MIEALHSLKDVAVFSPEIYLLDLVGATNLVIRHCNNLRSKITAAAVETLKQLFSIMKKKLIPNLNSAVRSSKKLFFK